MSTNTQTSTKLHYEDVHIGDALPVLVKSAITHQQLVRYAGASGDLNPLHTDPTVGEMVGTGGLIAHGMLIMGFVGQMLSDFVGPTALRRFHVRFKGMTYPGDVITCTGSITEKYEANGEDLIAGNVQAVDQAGNVKLAGSFVAALPKRSQG